MKVLIACEFSGVVRRAFTTRGHDAWSCDLLPAEDGSNRHIRGDVRDILDGGWDMLIVAHPPCTRLCRSGRRWLSGPGYMTPPKKLPNGRTWESMKAEFEYGVNLFITCWRAPIDRVAIENPKMHDIANAGRYLGLISVANYYNEFDSFAAETLRNLIAAGHLPAGDVDERDIRDVRADDLAGYTQCHTCARRGRCRRGLRQ